MGIVSLAEAARDLFQKPVTAIATHIHFDHVGGLHEFEHRIIHRLEADQMAERILDAARGEAPAQAPLRPVRVA